MKLSFRQGIVRHQTDSNNNPLFLQSSGTNVTLFVSPDPTIYSISHNVSEYLVTEPVTVNDAWVGPFTPGNQYWLYFDIDITTGIRTFGHTVTEPTAAAVPPLAPVVDQHWFDVATRQMKIWSGTSWRVRVRVFAARYDSTTFTSMSILAPDFRGTQAGLTQPFNSGGIVYDASGRPVRNSNGNFFTTEDLFTANTPSGSSLKINTIIVNATAQEPLAAFQVVQFSDFNEIIHANPFDQNTVVFGILEEDAPTGESVRVVTEGRLTYDQWDWEAAGAEVNDYIYIDNTGMLVLAPVIADQTPVGQVIDLQTIIFRPSVLKAVLDSGGSSDHSTLTNLTNDDHLQYFNEIRGDIRYYPRTELDPILLGKSDVGHVHTKADITDFAHIHTIAQVTNLQPSLDQKINRNGDVMDATANLTFSAGGEILGLPDLPTDDSAAASKFYVDNIPTGDVYTAGTNITFTGSPSAINVEPQGVGSGLDAEYWSNEAININSPVNGEVLTYQAGVWVNAAGGGGGSTSRINDTDNDTYVDTELAADVDTVVIALGDGADDFDAAAVAVFGRSSIDIAALNNTGGSVAGGDVNATAGNSTDVDGGSVVLTGGETIDSYVDSTEAFGATLTLEGGKTTGGGDSILSSGNVPGGSLSPGDTIITTGTRASGAESGNIIIRPPASFDNDNGNVTIGAAEQAGGNRDGGDVLVHGGHGTASGPYGANGGEVTVQGGDSTAETGGDVIVKGGAGGDANGNVIVVGPDATTAGAIQFNDNDDSHSVTLQAPATVTADVTYTLPVAPTVSGYILSSTTAGVMTWVVGGGGGGDTWRIIDGDLDTFVRTEVSAGSDEDEVVIQLGDGAGDAHTPGPVANFARSSTTITTLATTDVDGLPITIKPGDTYFAGTAGSVNIVAGDMTFNHGNIGGDVNISASGNAAGYDTYAGTVNITGADSYYIGGAVNVTGGICTYDNGYETQYKGGAVNITGGYSESQGGDINIVGGDSNYPDYGDNNYYKGGSVSITSGYGDNGGDISIISSEGIGLGDGGNTLVGAASGGYLNLFSYRNSSVFIEGGYGGSTSEFGRVDISSKGGGDVRIYTNEGDITLTSPNSGAIIIEGQDDGDVSVIANTGDLNLFGNSGIHIKGSIICKGQTGSLGGTVRFNDDDDSHYIALTAPDVVTTSLTYVLPHGTVELGGFLQATGGGPGGITTAFSRTQDVSAPLVMTSGVPLAHNHSLGIQFVQVSVYDSTTNVLIPITGLTLTDADNISVTIGSNATVRLVTIGVPNTLIPA